MTEKLTEIATKLNRESRFDDMPRLIFITDNKAQPHPEDVITRLPSGSMVILRDYDDDNRVNLGKALCYICKVRNIKFFVAGDLTLALLLEADGLHLPEYMVSEAETIKAEYPSLLLTTAAHDEKGVMEADKLNLFAVLLSPIFPTESHPETYEDEEKTIGVHKLNTISKAHRIPIYALGGINIKTAVKLLNTKIAGFAGIRGF